MIGIQGRHVMQGIRRVRRGDLPSILRIENKSFARDAWSEEMFLDYIARPGRSVFLVAVVNGAVVGYVLAFHTLTRAELHSLAVAPANRRQGIAGALLAHTIGSLRRRGFLSVSLCVRVENKRAIALYRAFGFQRVRRINGYYEDGGPAWRMRKAA